MTAEDAKTILLAVLAFGFIIAILLGLADTGLYPLALGAVVVALVWELLNNPTLAAQFSGLVQSASKRLQ